jgi:hypothetical protein
MSVSGNRSGSEVPPETRGPAQVSPAEFIHIVQGKEDLTGNQIIWAQWPTKENKK